MSTRMGTTRLVWRIQAGHGHTTMSIYTERREDWPKRVRAAVGETRTCTACTLIAEIARGAANVKGVEPATMLVFMEIERIARGRLPYDEAVKHRPTGTCYCDYDDRECYEHRHWEAR